MEKNQPFPIRQFHQSFSKSLTGYEVEIYIGDAPSLVTLIGEAINLIMWLFLKTLCGT